MALHMGQYQRVEARLEQRMILAPQIIVGLEILQMPMMVLQQRIDQELLENPLLEESEPEPEAGEERPESPEDRRADEMIKEGEDFAKLDNLGDDYREYFYQTSSRPAPSDKDEKLEALSNTPGRSMTLPDYLEEQLRFLDLDGKLREAVEYLSRNLSRDGYLAAPLEELAQGWEGGQDGALLEEGLRVLQGLDPPGVGARNLVECLLVQLEPSGESSELVERIVRERLEDVRMNRLPKMAKELGCSIDEVKAAVAQIQTLNPAPGRVFDSEVVPYIMPDVIIEYVDGRYEVSLNDRSVPRLRVSEAYREMMEKGSAGKEAKDYVRAKYDSARWFMEAIQQRRNTLLKVAREIVRAQQDFLERGLGHLRPLKMQEVADATGMHVTTVSRAIREKYAQTPRGIFALKFFFSGGVRTDSGESESFSAIRQRIVEIVEKEDKSRPLSDDEIVAALNEHGIELARRTVTKYRKALNIPSSRRRKAY